MRPGTFYAVDQGNYRVNVELCRTVSSFALFRSCISERDSVAGSTSGKMYAFNAQTGAVIWQKALGSYGIESGAALHAGTTLYVGDNNDVYYALDANASQEKWRFTAFSKYQVPIPCFLTNGDPGADDANGVVRLIRRQAAAGMDIPYGEQHTCFFSKGSPMALVFIWRR